MPTNRLPIHEQIRSYIYTKIRSGEWPAGHQIPSEREFTELFKVSRVTVRHALNNLANEGLLRRQQGQGTFVSIPKVEMVQGELISITALMQRQGHVPETIVTKLLRKPLDATDAEQLGESIGEEVYVIQRIRKANGVPVVLENTRLPCRKVQGIDQYDLVKSSVFTLMAEVYHYADLTVHQTIEADIASEEVARLLNIEQNAPVLCVNRMVHDQLGELVEAAQDLYPANRVRFVYDGNINLQESQQKFKSSTASMIEMQ